MIIPIAEEIILPEFWVSLECVPEIGRWYYISTWGRIYNEYTDTILPQNIYYDKDKYISISLMIGNNNCISRQIHRLMMETFLPIDNPNDFDVNHKDGIKYHNWIWNLEWMSHKDNMRHAVENKLFNLGETRKNSKLSNDQVKVICELLEQGKGPTEISNIMNINDINIKRIATNIKGKLSWKHISCNYNIDFTKND